MFSILWLWVLGLWGTVAEAIRKSFMTPDEKDRYLRLKRQMEYYFSDQNYYRDPVMQEQRDQDRWIALETFLTFPMIKQLGANINDLRQSLRYSLVVQLSSDGSKVRRRFESVVTVISKADTEKRSLYIKTFPAQDLSLTTEYLEQWFRRTLRDTGVNIKHVNRFCTGTVFSGSVAVELETAQEADKVVEKYKSSPLKFEETTLSVIKLSDHKKSSSSKSGTGTPRPEIIWKDGDPFVLTEEALKLLEEWRNRYKTSVSVTLEAKQIKQTPPQFSCSATCEYNGEKLLATTPPTHPHKRKADAARYVEWHIFIQIVKLNGQDLDIVEKQIVHATSDAVASEDLKLQDKYARRAEFTRLKKMFPWANPADLEKLAMGTGTIETLSIGSDKTQLRLFEQAVKQCGWYQGLVKFEKTLRESKLALSMSSAAIAPNGPTGGDVKPIAPSSASRDTPLGSDELDFDDDEAALNIALEISQLPVSRIEIGYLESPSDFAPLWTTKCDVSVDFDHSRPLMSLLFTRHTVQHKISNIIKEFAEPIRIEALFHKKLSLKSPELNSSTSEAPSADQSPESSPAPAVAAQPAEEPAPKSSCTVLIKMAKAPRLMKKPLNYQSWVRSLDYTPNKAWNNATHIRLTFDGDDFEANQNKVLWILLSMSRIGLASFYSKPESFFSVVKPSIEDYKLPDELKKLTTVTRFKIDCVVSNHVIIASQVTPEFINLLVGVDEDVSVKILDKLESYRQRNYNPCEFLRNELSKIRQEPAKAVKVRHWEFIPHVVFTPLRMICEGPIAEISNRILRAFPEQKDRFIRVSFKEEDAKSSIRGVGKSTIRDRVGKTLNNGFGLQFVGMDFAFFVFSSGQLRGHKSWFFSEGDGMTCKGLRQWMGNFERIFNVAMYSSRLGQALSSTFATIEVPDEFVEVIEDVKRNGLVFSDGVGTISPELAKQMAAKLPFKDGRIPSVYQIRYGGAKGVLTIDHRLEGVKMRLRPSMIKFKSQHHNVEVCGWGKAIPAHLNKQVIIILSARGVEDQHFLDLQKEALERLQSISVSNINTEKEIELLESTWRAKNAPNSLPGRAVKMLRSGFQLSQEPYLHSLLRVLNVRRFQELRVMARIPIEEGQYAIGVMDEYNLLEYGQVFYQQHLGNGKMKIHTGPLNISRSPSLHPGDVRILTGVDIPELHGYVDCLVFPQKGERPHPHECSGGDLDGDQYLVLWDPRLFPVGAGVDVPPSAAHETTANSIRSKDDNQVTESELKEFFVEYMLNDKLGQIADAHMYHADKSPQGVFDPNCLKLAEYHNIAVDSAKTGKTVPSIDDLNPPEYPDFMDMPMSQVYPSKKILGKLYRTADEQVAMVEQLAKNSAAIPLKVDEDLIVPGYEQFLDSAKEARDEYSGELSVLIHRYTLKDEFEAISGDVVWETAGQRRDWLGLRDGFEKEIQLINEKYRVIFFGFGNQPELTESTKQKASAWYLTTYDEKLHGTERVRISFPWVVDDILCEVKKANVNRKAQEKKAKDLETARQAEEKRLRKQQEKEARDTLKATPAEGNPAEGTPEVDDGLLAQPKLPAAPCTSTTPTTPNGDEEKTPTTEEPATANESKSPQDATKPVVESLVANGLEPSEPRDIPATGVDSVSVETPILQ